MDEKFRERLVNGVLRVEGFSLTSEKKIQGEGE